MNLPIEIGPAPLTVDEHGVIRVTGTRVQLELIIYQFRTGATPEQIIDSFSTLELADVYAVLAYYLRHRVELDAYVARRQEEAERLRCEVMKRIDTSALRARMLARKAS